MIEAISRSLPEVILKSRECLVRTAGKELPPHVARSKCTAASADGAPDPQAMGASLLTPNAQFGRPHRSSRKPGRCSKTPDHARYSNRKQIDQRYKKNSEKRLTGVRRTPKGFRRKPLDTLALADTPNASSRSVHAARANSPINVGIRGTRLVSVDAAA
ncbi:MAG: hypothetical protein ABI212_11905 [Burkholderiaceae bacterium]